MPLRPAARGAIVVGGLWAPGVAADLWLGDGHGHVPEQIRASLPYEWDAVALVFALLSIEAVALFWLLFRFRARAIVRTLAALGLFGAALVLHVLTTPSDLPASRYVNVWWALLVWLMLAASLAVQLTASAFARMRARRASRVTRPRAR